MTIRTGVFGGCNVRGPFRAVRKQSLGMQDAGEAEVTFAGVPFFTYTIGEMIQAVNLYCGAYTPSAEARLLCNIKSEFNPNPVTNVRIWDVAIIEPATSIELVYRGSYINRASMLNFLRTAGSNVEKLLAKWYSKGVCAFRPDIVGEIAEKIIPQISREIEHYDLICSLLHEINGIPTDLEADLARFIKLCDVVPVGVVLYTWAYMPDGRPVSWPAAFHAELVKVCSKLNLPTFDPNQVIATYGFEKAIGRDLRHYTKDFIPVIGQSLADFARSVAYRDRQKTWREEFMAARASEKQKRQFAIFGKATRAANNQEHN